MRMTCGVMIIVLVSLTTLRHFWSEGLQWWTTVHALLEAHSWLN